MPYSIEQKLVGLAKESSRGVAEVAVARFIAPGKAVDFEYKPTLLQDEAIRGMFDSMPPTHGKKAGIGKIPDLDVEGENAGELLYSLLGGITSTEQTSFVVGATNKKLDFSIGGDPLVATLAEGTYKAGLAETEADSLCKVIYDAIVAAEAVGVYHVTYSYTTKKFTIARTTGTLSLLWYTGVNKATDVSTLLGYSDAADDTGSLSYTSDTATVPYFKHIIKRTTGISMPSYTFFMDRGISKKVYNLGVVKSIKLTGAMDGKCKADIDLLFKSEADGSAVTMTPTWTDPAPFMFFQTDVKLGGVSDVNIESWNLEIDNQAIEHRTLNQSQDVKDIISPSRLLVKGSYEVYFENETERAKFLANTENSFEVILTGGLVKTGCSYKLDIKLARIHYEAFPYGEKNGLFGAVAVFNGYFKVGGAQTEALVIDMYNSVAAY